MKNIFSNSSSDLSSDLSSYLLVLLISISLFACDQVEQSKQDLTSDTPTQFTSFTSSSHPPESDFTKYWYQGEAEISSYKLEQARYGEVHEGHSVLVFVTEDFSKSKQVKLDNAGAAGSDRVPILKLNFTKKFNTGIYPYSIMQSIFTPVSLDKYPNTLKTTMSMQEWCGHVFAQLNEKKDHYDLTSFSYFESEGDAKSKLAKALLEDELWTRIRINPEVLPVGKVKLIPSLSYSRLKHRPLKVQEANISLTEQGENKVYSIQYPAEKRKLSIVFSKTFPYQIQSWEETYRSGWGPNAQDLVTKGTLMESLKNDYWSRNSTADLPLRQELGLPK